jgi:outer membrane protein TolC
VSYGNDTCDNKNEWKVGITLSIPLWNRESARHGALKANERFLRSELEALDNVSFEEVVRRAYQRLIAQITAVNNYQTKILPNYEKSMRKIETSFLNGQTSILDVWQIREKYTQAQGQSLVALQGALLAKIELEQLIGIRLEDI